MYVCGVTVYDDCHIGHGRTFIAFDVIRRWLQASGYDVKFIRNVTDIDDKIIKRAAERGVLPEELAKKYTERMQEDFRNLGCLGPTVEPRATQYIPKMLALIETLEEKGYAYQDKNGDVDYSVRKFAPYASPARKSTSFSPENACRLTLLRKIRWTLRFGRALNPVSRCGILSGARDVPAGISNARR